MLKKNTILENIHVDKLIFGGKGLAQSSDGYKIIISGGAIPGSFVDLRILKKRKNHYEAQIVDVRKKSSLEQELPEHFQVYGGCKWLPIPYEKQLTIKQEQIQEAFHHIKNAPYMKDAKFHDIVASPDIYGYRNKVEFSWGKYISSQQDIHDEYRFGFHEQGSFDRIIDCSYCVLGDDVVNSLFTSFDRWARQTDLPTYDQKTQEGFWRHLVIRQGKNTGEVMIILSVNSDYVDDTKSTNMRSFSGALVSFLEGLEYEIASAYLLHNNGKADIVDGRFEHIYGQTTIIERLVVDGRSLCFEIAPKSFFQTNTSGASKLYEVTRSMVTRGSGVLLDLYAGTGTIGIIVSDLASQVISVELVASSSADNKKNLTKNNIKNVSVVNKKVEDFLADFRSENTAVDTIIIDPPRAGMHPSAPQVIPEFEAKEIVYVSCNPSTLVRDLEVICEHSQYQVTDITPVDMFPHTHHIETVVRLKKTF